MNLFLFLFLIMTGRLFSVVLISEEDKSTLENSSKQVEKTQESLKSRFANAGSFAKLSVNNKYGEAILQRLQNQTNFPIKITTGNTNKKNFFLQTGFLIRLRLMSDQFEKKPFLLLHEDFGSLNVSRLIFRADGFNPDEEGVLFNVLAYKSSDDSNKNIIELSPLKYPNQKLGCGIDLEDEFLVESRDDEFFREDVSAKQWVVFGDQNKCYLQNVKTGGFLGPVDSSMPLNDTKNIFSLNEKIDDIKDVFCNFGDACSFISMKNTNLKIAQHKNQFLLDTNQEECLWLIKGPHAEGDRYNCKNGSPIISGSVVRLELIGSGKNLSLGKDDIKNDEKSYFERKTLFLNGENGVGGEDDNWIIFFDKDQSNLALKSIVSLQHLTSNSWLCVDDQNNLILLSKKQIAVDSENEKTFSSGVTSSVQAVDLKSLNSGLNSKESLDDQIKNENEKKKTITKPDSGVATPDEFGEQKKFQISMIKKNQINHKNLIRTGFLKGSAFDRIGTTIPNNQELSIEIKSQGQGDILLPQTDRWFNNFSLLTTPLILDGAAKSIVPNLFPGMSLLINPLYGSGVVWIEKSLLPINECLLNFLVRQTDEADFAVVLGNAIDTSFCYKLVFSQKQVVLKKMNLIGNQNNAIEDLITISTDENPFAKIQAGQVIPIWILFNKGEFFVGASLDVGSNMFFAYSDRLFSGPVDRVGFSCDQDSVFVAEVNVGSGRDLLSPTRVYEKNLKLNKGVPNSSMSSNGFRQKDQCLLFFQGRTVGDENFYFFNDDARAWYRLNINFRNGDLIIAKKSDSDEKVIFHTNNQSIVEFNNKDKNIWIYFRQGFFWIGLDNPGDCSVFCFQDLSPIFEVNKFSLASRSGFVDAFSYSDISFSLEKTLINDVVDHFLNAGKTIGIAPFLFKIEQQNEQILFYDQLSKHSYLVATAEKSGNKYPFLLNIDPQGIPQMRLAWQPQDQSLLALKWQTRALATAAEGLILASSHMQGSGKIGEVVGSGVAVTLASLSVPVAISAGQAAGNLVVAQKLQEAKTKDIKNTIKYDAKITHNIPPLAVSNRYLLESMLNVLEKFSPSTKQNYVDLLNRAEKALSYIVHPYVVGTPQIKNNLKKVFTSLYDAQKNAQNFLIDSDSDKDNVDKDSFVIMIRQRLMNLLVKAIQNQYLFANTMNDFDEKKIWFSWANILFQNVFDNVLNQNVILPPLLGEFFWLKNKLSSPGVGKVYIDLKTSSEFWIAFAAGPKIFDIKKEFYTIVLRNADNNNVMIKLKPLGADAAISQDESLRLNSLDFKKIYVSIFNGVIDVGIVNHNDGSETSILQFNDKYPLKNELYVGLGTWNNDCEIKNVFVLAKDDFPFLNQADDELSSIVNPSESSVSE